MNGKFVVFEGVDNSGKTTTLENVTKWLEAKGLEVVPTKHPGATPLGRELRHLIKHSDHPVDPNTEALIFAADNSAFINQVLRPKLAANAWVLGDRNNFVSSLAYQIASGCSFDELDRIHASISNPPRIDLLFVLRCDWETAQERKRAKQLTSKEPAKDRFEDRGRAYFDKLVECYDQIIELHSHRLKKFVRTSPGASACCDRVPRCVYIDATQPIDTVFKLVTSSIQSLILDSQEDQCCQGD